MVEREQIRHHSNALAFLVCAYPKFCFHFVMKNKYSNQQSIINNQVLTFSRLRIITFDICTDSSTSPTQHSFLLPETMNKNKHSTIIALLPKSIIAKQSQLINIIFSQSYIRIPHLFVTHTHICINYYFHLKRLHTHRSFD